MFTSFFILEDKSFICILVPAFSYMKSICLVECITAFERISEPYVIDQSYRTLLSNLSQQRLIFCASSLNSE